MAASLGCSGLCAELDLQRLSGHAGLLGARQHAGEHSELLVVHAAGVAQGAGPVGAAAPLGGLACPTVVAGRAAARRAAYKRTQARSAHACHSFARVISATIHADDGG